MEAVLRKGSGQAGAAEQRPTPLPPPPAPPPGPRLVLLDAPGGAAAATAYASGQYEKYALMAEAAQSLAPVATTELWGGLIAQVPRNKV